jgi:phosphoribosylformylglycinamidine cyclo-ligase
VLFRVLMRGGQIGRDEMRRVFNLGIGMIAVVDRADVEVVVRAADRAQVQTWIIGDIRAAKGGGGKISPAVRFEER